MPGNYQGAVLEVTGRVLQPGSDETGNRSGGHDTYGEEEEEDGDADEQEAEVKIAEQAGLFDEFVVWGHDAAPQEMEDPYLKGINEWIGFAEAVSVHGSQPTLKADQNRCMAIWKNRRALYQTSLHDTCISANPSKTLNCTHLVSRCMRSSMPVFS